MSVFLHVSAFTCSCLRACVEKQSDGKRGQKEQNRKQETSCVMKQNDAVYLRE